MTQTENYNLNVIEKTDKIIDSISKLGENAQKIDEALKNAEELFIAVYGTTTYAEIQTAVGNGKIILLDYGGSHRLQLTYISAEQFNFAGFVDAGNTLFNAVCNSNSEWTLESSTVQGKLTAGNNITLEGNVINAVIDLTEYKKIIICTQDEYDALTSYEDVMYCIPEEE